jgi:hypothetical protein
MDRSKPMKVLINMSWRVVAGIALSLPVLAALSAASWEPLITLPSIAVLLACTHRCANTPWLWRDRRYADPAPELFGEGRVETTIPAVPLMRGVDLREITTPSWSIDFAT